ncbi:hypothetical protein [Parabacteroides merdae]|uniref:hypothetical protein n=1 Tax=Parabacteroides merdae TaxID=46503 RepID=UPI0034A428C7
MKDIYQLSNQVNSCSASLYRLREAVYDFFDTGEEDYLPLPEKKTNVLLHSQIKTPQTLDTLHCVTHNEHGFLVFCFNDLELNANLIAIETLVSVADNKQFAASLEEIKKHLIGCLRDVLYLYPSKIHIQPNSDFEFLLLDRRLIKPENISIEDNMVSIHGRIDNEECDVTADKICTEDICSFLIDFTGYAELNR